MKNAVAISTKHKKELSDYEEGFCYDNASLYMERHSSIKEMQLVHGVPLGTGGEIRGKRYGHAWVEIGSDVIDPSVPNPVLVINKQVYYAIGNIKEKNVKRYSYEEMLKMMVKFQTRGPWDKNLIAQETI